MRASLVAFCTLAVCAAQDYSNPGQAQEPSDPNSAKTDIPDTPPASAQEELVTPAPSISPEVSVTERFSSSRARDALERLKATASEREALALAGHPETSLQTLISQSSPNSTTESLTITESPSESTQELCLERQEEDSAATETVVSLAVISDSEGSEELLEERQEAPSKEGSQTASANPVQLTHTLESTPECDLSEPVSKSEPVLASLAEPPPMEEGLENTQTNPTAESTETVLSPLETPPGRLFNLETANQLPNDALQLSVGTHQTLPDDAPGTGDQLYYGSIDWGATDDLQLSLAYQNFDDSPAEPINGVSPNITLESIAPSIKYRLLMTERVALGLQGSVEYFSFESDLFNSDDSGGDAIIGSLHAPLTYTASPELQLHLTPGVSFLPDDINDIEFYDTIFSIGTGVSWQPSERWLAYGNINLPIGPGGNTIDDDQSISRQPVWTLGTRYNATPRVGLDVYATNGFGTTPATGILSFPPDGDNLLLGVKLNYTPDNGLGYRSSYRDTPSAPLSERDRQLKLDGLTLTSANTLEPGTVAFNAVAGTDGNYSVGLAYSPDEALQIEAILEEFAEDGSVDPADIAGDDLKYLVGARLQLLDQHQGDPVSLAARLLGGRDTSAGQQVGTIFVDVPVTFQANSRTALFLNPRLAAFGNESNVGVGFGVNYELARGLQLIGEVTPVFDRDRTVWAAGTRYSLPNAAVSLDLYATNAVGRNGLGTLVGQSDTRFGVGLNWMIGK